ncbi:hypothetical protein [Domibacillus tundrae]|uniref:hypothetical protein n=1 Tax=Domibacillus tundrae TaxID=1587527 RepID=UPI00155B1334|nr:hypothetical protein [Domibacillus tundrae]
MVRKAEGACLSSANETKAKNAASCRRASTLPRPVAVARLDHPDRRNAFATHIM